MSLSSGPCDSHLETIKMKYGNRKFPTVGNFVVESHIRVGSETIDEHLSTSYFYYPFKDVYKNSWDRQWTPPEGGGKEGQGSTEYSPSWIEEIYRANMYFSKNRPLGEKWILRRGDRTIVVDMSHELGPAKKNGDGGVSSEVAHFLGGTDNIWAARLIDNETPLGAIECKEK